MNKLSKIDIITSLLILTTITACIKEKSYHIALVSIAFLAYKLLDRYLTIQNAHLDRKDIFDSLDEKLVEIEKKVSRLSDKEAAKDMMMQGLNRK